MLRKLVGAGLITAVMTGAAVAQMPMPSISLGHDDQRKLTPEEQARQDATDHAYKSQLQKIPEKKTVDPWGNIRGAGQPQAAQTPSKSKQQ